MGEASERTNGEERPVRRRNPQATRDRLLAAARRRFAGLGYERTTLRDVAADADVVEAWVKDGGVLSFAPDQSDTQSLPNWAAQSTAYL